MDGRLAAFGLAKKRGKHHVGRQEYRHSQVAWGEGAKAEVGKKKMYKRLTRWDTVIAGNSFKWQHRQMNMSLGELGWQLQEHQCQRMRAWNLCGRFAKKELKPKDIGNWEGEENNDFKAIPKFCLCLKSRKKHKEMTYQSPVLRLPPFPGTF